MRNTYIISFLLFAIAGHAFAQPVKCGWNVHDRRDRDRIEIGFHRELRHRTYFTPNSTFAVHYDTSGTHAPNLTSSQPDGTPDWVVEVGAALDSVRSLLLALGFNPALPDDDGIFDVYLQDNGGGLYGETFYTPHGSGEGFSAYIEMENDFAAGENYHTHGLGAAQVTCAHEYFHAVQLSQPFRDADVFFYELSSTWFEEVAYPEVDDWVYWFDEIRGFAHDPAEDMVSTDGYSIAAFGHYLTSRAPDTLYILPRIWEQFVTTSAREAINKALEDDGSTLTTAWTDFVGRLFLNRQTPQYYFHPDQAQLAELAPVFPHDLTELQRVNFDGLTPGKVAIRALEVAADEGFSFEVEEAPSEYAARIVIRGDQPYFGSLGRDTWLGTGTGQPTGIILVAGAARDSVVVAAIPGPVRFALNNLYPNPLSLSDHGSMFLEFVVPGNMPAGRHRLVVYDLLGREVYREAFDEPAYGQLQSLELPSYTMRTWASGVYFLRLSLGSATAIRRFILLK